MNIKRFIPFPGLLKAVLLVLVLASAYSCVPTRKMKYMQDLSKKKIPASDSFYVQSIAYRLRPNDMVNMSIKSIDKKYEDMFTVTPVTMQSINIEASDVFYLNGFMLNDSGYIRLPIVGEIQLSGLTVKEAETRIQKALLEYLTYAFVNLKVGGIRFSILGEIQAPGKYTIMQNDVTIFDALSRAGDLTTFANREEVCILRKVSNTEVKMVRINVLDKNLINSRMYFIQPDDIIYIPPLKVKQYGLGTNGFQTLTGVLTILTSLLVISQAFK